jgi:hypothetical protein
MLRKTSNGLRRLSTGWVTLAALVIFIVFMALVLPGQASKAEEASSGAGSPDTSYVYSPQDLYDIAEAYGDDGRQVYVRMRWTFDLAFPLVYGFFLITSISWLFTRGFPENSRWQLANLAPVLGVLFDLLENTSTSIVMARYPLETPMFVWLAPVFTFVKWIFVLGSFVLLVIGLVKVVSGLLQARFSRSAKS